MNAAQVAEWLGATLTAPETPAGPSADKVMPEPIADELVAKRARLKVKISNIQYRQRYGVDDGYHRHVAMRDLVTELWGAGVTSRANLLHCLNESEAASSKVTEESGGSLRGHLDKILAKPGPWNDQPAPSDSGGVGLPASQSRFKTLADLRRMPPPVWRVDGLIPEWGVGQLFGPHYSGKTFVAVDLALSVACGQQDWLGYQVKKPGAVFYVLMEGSFDFADRVGAWERHNDQRVPGNFYTLCEEDVNLADRVNIQRLTDDIRTCSDEPALLVIDTQSLAIRGVDEDNNTGMNEVMQNLKKLAKHLNCFVLLVHHTGHSNQERSRGASAVAAALDLIMGVKVEGSGKDKKRRLFVQKVKAGRENMIGRGFKLASVGRTAVFSPLDIEEQKAEFDEAMSLAQRILACVSEDPISIKVIATRLGIDINRGSEGGSGRNKDLQNAIRQLVQSGELVKTGDGAGTKYHRKENS